MTPAQYQARRDIIREHWGARLTVLDICDLVNADGIQPRWTEVQCRKHAEKMQLFRPKSTPGGDSIRHQTDEDIRLASWRFAVAFR